MSAPTVVNARPDDAPAPATSKAQATNDEPPRRARGPWWRNLDDWLGIAIVIACGVYILIQLQPDLVLRNTTAAGGDMGAHVWWPAYLRDHLLPWRIAGWSPDFYAGFPAGQYYFPIPALLTVGLDVLIPYNVAFKLVTILGAVIMPAGAYVFAKGIRAPKPTPAAFAIAITSFLFFTGDPGTSEAAKSIAFNQRIMGGTLASTMAGEFSFTLAVSLAFFFFGSLAWALRTRHHLWVPAALLAGCLMSHLIVGVFAAIGALAIWVFSRPVQSSGRAVAIGGVGLLLSGVWLVPLLATMSYTTNMRYGAIREFRTYLFPSYFFNFHFGWPYEWGAYVLSAIAIVAAVGFLRRSTFTVLLITVVCGLAFRFWSELGTHVWNLRVLSFWYIGIHLMMAIGVAELIRGAGWLAGAGWRKVTTPKAAPDADADADADAETEFEVASTAVAVRPAWYSRVPAKLIALVVTMALTAAASVAVLNQIDDNKDFIPYWAKWNYSGYENMIDEVDGEYTAPCTNAGSVEQSIPTDDPASPLCVYTKTVAIGKQWPEYHALMEAVGKLPPGRSFWEGGGSLDKYGTPLALMLIPYWTKGRITTMEGVYFEASGTTPYSFEAVAALVAPGENSNPVRGVPYRDQSSFDQGVRYLQKMGIDYFIAHNPTTKGKADADPRLTLISQSPDFDAAAPLGWNIYKVADAPLVEGLAYEPVIAKNVAPDPEGWEQQVAAAWWWSPKQLDKPVVASGLDSWRAAEGSAALRLPRRAITPAKVTNIKADTDSITFDVDRVGQPVMVKASYYPNWTVSGADGPFRATPNFMVVVPTEKHVTLTYGTTKAEWFGRYLTLSGLVGLGVLVVWGRRRKRRGTGTTIPFRPATGLP